MLKPLRVVFGVLLLVLFVGPAFAQTVDTAWVRRYDGSLSTDDRAQAIAVDDSGYIYVTGFVWNAGTSQDYGTIKYLPNGDTAWLRTYTIGSQDQANAIVVDESGNIYVTGQSLGDGTSWDYATVKYLSNGDTAWARRYDGPVNGGDEAHAIAVDGSGNVCVTGRSTGCCGNYDYLTIKYYQDGGTAWVERYDGPGNDQDYANAIGVDGSGDFYVTGGATGFATLREYTTIKYCPEGGTWRTYHAANYNDRARAIAIDGSGNVYVTGESIAGSPTWSDFCTIKYLPNGDTAWLRKYNGPGNTSDFAQAITLDVSGNVYVTGFGSGGVGAVDADYITIKYLPNGDTAWVRRYNGSLDGTDQAAAIAVDTSGNVYVTGYSTGSGADWDYATVKYLANGDSGWVMRYNGPGNGDDLIGGIAVDDSGNVYVTGYSEGDGTGDDYCTIKYVQTPSEVKDETGDRERPSEFDLSQNYPNPFNPTTKIEFTLAKSGFVTLQIYDVLGRKVRTLVSEELSSGYKSVIWDSKNDAGDDVASAVYFYQLKVGDFSEPKKMLLLK
jgi:hypothetical protein